MSYEWHPSTTPEFTAFFFGLLVFFVTLWCSVCLILATLSGWRRLAESYRHVGRFEGRRWSMKSARMRWGVNYNNCLTFGANREGVYMAVMFLFRLGGAPLFIPWSDVGWEERRGWLFRYIVFTFLNAPGIPVVVPRALGLSLLEAGGRDQLMVGRVVA